MNIKLCKGISVEKDIYGSKDYFCQEDVVQVTATNYDDESKTMEGRFCDAYSRNAELYILLDTSSKYHKDSLEIPVGLITNIKKVPD